MKKRLVITFCCFLLFFSFLYLRIGFITNDQKLMKAGTNQTSYTLSFNQTRGQIYDCNLNPFVSEQREYLACVLPTPHNMGLVSGHSMLKIPQDYQKLSHQTKPFWVEATTDSINIPNVTVLPVDKRCNNSQLAQHIIGYVDNTGTKGLTGIERAYDSILSANSEKSTITYTIDGSRNPLYGIEPSIKFAPYQVNGVVLTIDKRIQEIVETAGRKHIQKGAVVVMEPKTGKLKAVASFPSYDSNKLSEYVFDEENSPMLNRAFCAYNVGSVFKVVTSATALTQGINPNQTYNCTGKIEVLDVTFKCHDIDGHGNVNLKTALAVSCNPYFINLASSLSPQKFLNMASDLSFGKATEFTPTLKTASGTLPTIAELKNPAGLANLAFGQGSLLATPVQVAQMMSSIANEGKTMPASIFEGETSDGKLITNKPSEGFPINAMDKKVADTIKDYLVSAVMETSNQKAKPTYTTAGGKTSTAQTGQMRGSEEICQGWFAGFFPADNPQYVIVVVSEDAKSGNQNSSPVFKEIVDELTKPKMLPESLR